MRKFLAHYFYYTRKERTGILTFLVFIAITNIISVFVPMIKTPIPDVNFSETALEARHFESAILNVDESEPINKAFILFPFDPNNSPINDLLSLGLPQRVCTTLIHYREKGGRFYKPEDLKKIYGLSLDDYARLEPYINIADSGHGNNKFSSFYKDKMPDTQSEKKVVLQNFDPNVASESTLLNLGLEEKTVKIMLKYREKGGIFFNKEDIKKVYSFTDLDFLRLEPYIQITDNQTALKNPGTNTSQPEKYQNKKTNALMLDLNTAPDDDLLRIYGIGHTFAARITEYRTRLGGFSAVNQLKEVYGIPDSVINIATSNLSLSPVFRKIYINKAGVEALKHPYLTYKQADVIVRYRINHGTYKNTDDLKKTGVFDDAQLEKLKPYIAFND